MKNKIRAFTIVEVVVVMLLSSLVISLAYTGFGLIMSRYRSFDKSSSEITAIAQTQRCLMMDIDACNQLLINGTELICQYPLKQVVYRFEPGYILRTGDLADTIQVRSSSLKTFLGLEVALTPGQLIDRLQVQVLCSDTLLALNFKKQYSAADRMNP